MPEEPKYTESEIRAAFAKWFEDADYTKEAATDPEATADYFLTVLEEAHGGAN